MMFKNLIPLFAGLTLAGGLSQFPEFSQQYTQRVGGAYVELHAVAEGFRSDAAASGKTVDQAVDEYFATDSQFFHDRGAAIQNIIIRESYLKHHYDALIQGSGFDQLIEFTAARDIDLARDTLGIYKPAVPLTFVGAAHAGLGFLVGFVILRFPFLFRRRKSNRASPVAA